MINLFHIPTHKIDTSKFDHQLNGSIVQEVECELAEYLGAKYAVGLSSATNAIMLALWNKNAQVELPSELPNVVANAILLGGNKISFRDDPYWVGSEYELYRFKNGYRIIDSAQDIYKHQFIYRCNDNDILIHSFFPTKPLSGIDSGLISTNNESTANHFRCLVNNGNSLEKNSWERRPCLIGFKMYMSSCQAYVIKKNLKSLQKKLDKLSEIRHLYNKSFYLSNLSNHLYRINVKDRDDVMRKLHNRGIQCGIHYRLLSKNPLYCPISVNLPNSEWDSKTTLSIPFHEKLTKNEILYIIKHVQKYLIYN